MAQITMARALNTALRDAMEADDRVVLLGEDVGTLGGVFRITDGWAIGAVEHHSESPETIYCHTAGLKVVAPSSPADAYSLLRQSIESDDPVIFLEPKRRYWAKQELELPVSTGPMGQARILREGGDLTLVAYGPMVKVALDAAEAAEEEGVGSLEVIDLRTLVPLDEETLVASAVRTGRMVVVHEAPQFLGMGAEIAARVTEAAFLHLEAPVLRCTGLDIPYPPARLEEAHLPGVDRVLWTVQRSLEF
jgi:pyruvate dehydrogenase E1 component beta subunit